MLDRKKKYVDHKNTKLEKRTLTKKDEEHLSSVLAFAHNARLLTDFTYLSSRVKAQQF